MPAEGPPGDVTPAPQTTTGDLLARCRAGDRAAFNELYGRYLPRLTRLARGRLPRGTRDARDTDDLVQDTLVRTLGHLATFEPHRPGAFAAYLRRALVNRVRDEVRRASRRPTADEHGLDDLPDPAPSPLEEAIGREELARYELALARLSEQERELIVARLELNCSYQELAASAGRPSADAARMAVIRAVARLAREMGRNA